MKKLGAKVSTPTPPQLHLGLSSKPPPPHFLERNKVLQANEVCN